MNDAKSFNDIATNVFAKAYPAIAAQVIADTGITKGVCLDIGCGCGHLGFAMARAGDFEVVSVDPSVEMLEIATQNAVENGLSSRVRFLQGSAESVPLPDESVDIVVSRGSIFFWNDLERAFLDLYRVLKPSGMVYIGGGFGSAEIRDEVIKTMKERNGGQDTFVDSMKKRVGPDTIPSFRRALAAVKIPGGRVEQSSDKGSWVIFRKGVPQSLLHSDCQHPLSEMKPD